MREKKKKRKRKKEEKKGGKKKRESVWDREGEGKGVKEKEEGRRKGATG